MDPTIKLIGMSSSGETIDVAKDYPKFYSTNKTAASIIPLINIKAENTQNQEPLYCNTELYSNLKEIKAAYSDDQYEETRRKANPFEDLGRSIFMNRAAMKLACIDSLYDLTKSLGGFLVPYMRGPFTFCDIAGGPGSFSEYLQWRRPDAYGYGITLRDSKLNWNTSKLDMSRFFAYYGDSTIQRNNDGDLYRYWKGFIQAVRQRQPEGVDLAVADGGFDVEDKYEKQEFATSRLVLSEILVALSVLKIGGDFVCKIYDAVTPILGQLIYLCALCFKNITIVKPLASRMANAERYLVCKELKIETPEAVIHLLQKAMAQYVSDSLMVTQLFSDSLINVKERSFKQWLTEINDISIDTQLTTGGIILRMITGEPVDITKYFLYKVFTLWNIPDNGIQKKSYQKSIYPPLRELLYLN
jgi:23S rRNA U2552 (ribose-2'-O)-methylase RlmE/FtsJ